jgi:hypothetical protein
MTTPTPLPQTDIDAWEQKWRAKGLPQALLDAMIAEVELEWESQIGFGQINRLAQLTIQIIDYDITTNCFYLIVLIQNMNVFQGEAITKTTYDFAQVPCIPLSAYVLKLRDSDDVPICEGLASINHSKDETLQVELQYINGLTVQFPPLLGWLMSNFEDGHIGILESMMVSDSGITSESTKPIETFNVVNS